MSTSSSKLLTQQNRDAPHMLRYHRPMPEISSPPAVTMSAREIFCRPRVTENRPVSGSILMREYILPEGILSSLDGKTSALIIESYVRAFFDTYVRGYPRSHTLDEIPSRFDEVEFIKRTSR